jgi:site-specific DNA recombinase
MKRVIERIQPAEPLIPARLRVAAYARISCAKDAMLHSLAAQVDFYRKTIHERPDYLFAGVYADEALTGTKDRRPEFQRLLADCRAGKIDRVLTKSISRFARNTVDLLKTVRELRQLGVDVHFEEQNIHSMSGDGELMLAILASYAQAESLSASENQKWRVQKNFREGKPVGPSLMYGYDCRGGQFEVIPEEAETIRMIYQDYLSGMGKNAIMRKLIRLGTPTKRGGKWTETCVTGILRNEKLVGDLLLQKTWVTDHLTKRKRKNHGELPQYYVAGHHEAIISRATFEAVQDEIARRAALAAGGKKPETSAFTGMILCSRCGANFRRKINAAGTKYARATWACATYTNRGKAFCPAKRVPEDILIDKCAEALGLAECDATQIAAQFAARVAGISIPEDGVLVFAFKDETQMAVHWAHRSRRESWTPEMKKAARAAAQRRWQNG